MPDNADAAIAAGIQVPKTDIIGPLSSLAQFQYATANATRANAEAQNLGLQGAWIQAKNQAYLKYQDNVVNKHMSPQDALADSGLPILDPASAGASITALRGGMNLTDMQKAGAGGAGGLNPGAYRDPELAEKAATARNLIATTADTQAKIAALNLDHWGGLGSMIVETPDTPANRQAIGQQAHMLASQDPSTYRQYGPLIDKHLNDSPEQWKALGMQLQAAAQNEAAKVRSQGRNLVKVAGPTDQLIQGPDVTGGVSGAAGLPAQPVAVPPPGAIIPPLSGGGAAPAAMPTTPPPAPSAAPAARSSGGGGWADPSLPIYAALEKKYPGGYTAQDLARNTYVESKGNPNAVSPTGARGLNQWTRAAWAQYGVGDPTNPTASLEATAKKGQADAAALRPYLGRQPTGSEIYLAHNQGLGGALKLMENPNTRAGDLVGDMAIRVNGGDPNKPASAFLAQIDNMFNRGRPSFASGGVGSAVVAGNQAPVAPPTPSVNIYTGDQPENLNAAMTRGGTIAPLPQPKPNPPAAPIPAPPVPEEARPPVPVPAAANAVAPGAAVQTGTPQPATAPRLNLEDAGTWGAPRPASGAKQLPGGFTSTGGMTPGELKTQEVQGEENAKLMPKFGAEAVNARGQNAFIDTMKDTSQTWEPGKFADWKQDGREVLQALAKQAGIAAPDLDAATGDYQTFVKTVGNFVRMAVHETTSRSGVQEMQMVTKQLMSPTMSRYGLQHIFAQLEGTNDYTQAKALAAAEWNKQNGTLGPNSSGQDFQAYWAKNANPYAFILDRLGKESPEILKNVVANMSQTAEGRREIAIVMKDREWAKERGLINPNG